MIRTITFGISLLVAALSQAAAQDRYPSRAIKFVVPFTAGSATDTLARLLGNHVGATLGQGVIIENTGGGSGVPAALNVARAAPDGYTILITSNTTHASNQSMLKRVPYDAVADFEPISKLGTITLALVGHPSVPANNVQELIAYAKANPDKLAFGYGQGTAPQLVGEWFNKTNGLAIASVPYKGGMQAVTDMMTGAIQLNIGTTATLLPLIREGKIRAIAQWGATREPELPDVPTMIESGFPGLSLGFWAGLWAPAGTPQAVIDTLNAATNRVLDTPETRTAMHRLGVAPRIGTPKDFADFIAAEAPKWQRIVEASGVQIN